MQLAASFVVRKDGVRDGFLFALADDGTAWMLESPEFRRHWRQLPELPQPASDSTDG
jgi:hypothetical protein